MPFNQMLDKIKKDTDARIAETREEIKSESDAKLAQTATELLAKKGKEDKET